MADAALADDADTRPKPRFSGTRVDAQASPPDSAGAARPKPRFSGTPVTQAGPPRRANDFSSDLARSANRNIADTAKDVALYVPRAIGKEASAAFDGLKKDFEASRARPKELPPAFSWDEAKRVFGNLMATGKTALDAFRLVTSPITGATEALVTKPAGKVLARIPGVQKPGETREQTEQEAEQAVSTALFAARPGKVPARSPGAAPATGERAAPGGEPVSAAAKVPRFTGTPVPDQGGPILGPILGQRGLAAAAREAPPASADDLARSRAAYRTRPTEILGQQVHGAPREPPAFTEEELQRTRAARAAAEFQRATAADIAEAAPKRPPDLLDFLAGRGGLQDQGGELRALDAHRKFVPGGGMLVRKKGGLTLDYAREAAEEAGYLAPGSTISDLLDRISDNLRGARVFSDRDETAALAWLEHQRQGREPAPGEASYRDQLEERAHQLDIEPDAKWSDADLLAEIHEREAMMAEGEAMEPHADAIEAEIDRRVEHALPEAGEDVPFFEEGRHGETEPTPAQRAALEAPAAARAGPEPVAREAPRGEGAGAQPGSGAQAPPAGAGGPRGPVGAGRQPPLPTPPPRGSAFGRVARAVTNPIEAIFSPTTLSATSRAQEGLTREEIGRATRSTEAARAALDQHRSQIGARTPAEQLDFIRYVEGRSSGATIPDPSLQSTADTLRRVFAERAAKYRRLPSTAKAGFIEDFLPHIWRDPEKARATFAEQQQLRAVPTREGKGAHLKRREIPSYEEGIAAGLEPASTNPLDIAMAYTVEMDRFLAINSIFDRMLENETARYFVPGSQPEGWVPLQGRLAEKAAPIEREEGGAGAIIKRAYAPEDAARVYNNFISRGFERRREFGAVYDAAQRGVNSITMAELGFSAFHASTMAMESIISGAARGLQQASRGVGKGLRGQVLAGAKDIARGGITLGKSLGPWEPFLVYRTGGKFERQYLKLRDYGPDFERIVTLGERAGMRAVGRGREYLGARQGSFIRRGAIKGFFDAWKRGEAKVEALAAARGIERGFREAGREIAERPLIGTAKVFARNMARLMDTVGAPLFDHIIPRLKSGAFYDTMRDWLDAHPAAGHAEQMAAARQIWDSIDNRFGELVYDNLFWHRMLKQSLQLMTRAVGWDLGTLREIGGGAIDIARAGRDVTRGRFTELSPRAAYVIALPVVTALYNAAMGYLKTGQAPQSVADLYSYRTGGTNPDGSPERAMIPGYMKDVVGYAHDTLGTLESKASTGAHLVYELLTNRDYRGLPIGDPRAGIWTPQSREKLPGFLLAYIQHVMGSFVPITFRPTHRAGNLGAVERAMGVRPAPFFVQNPERLQQIEERNAERLMRAKQRSDIRQQQ